MVKTKYTCSFKTDWVNHIMFPDWSWLHPVADQSDRAYCTICNKTFDVGVSAVRSHAKATGHIRNNTNLKAIPTSLKKIFAAPTTAAADPTAEPVASPLLHQHQVRLS